MRLLGITTQAHVLDVCPHLSSAGNQFLHKGSASQNIWDFIHQLLEECGGVRDTEGHDLPAEDEALRGYKGEQFLGCPGWVYLQEALHLSILVLNRHLAILSRVFPMLGILPEWFLVVLLTSS